MKKKDLYKIINEEIGNFDFLNFDKVIKEESYYDTLNSKEFQTRLIYDLVHNSDSDLFDSITATYVHVDNELFDEYKNDVDFELELDIVYRYEENKYNITIFIDGEKNAEDEIDYDKTEIVLFNSAGQKIDISWIDNDVQLYNSLIDALVKPYVD